MTIPNPPTTSTAAAASPDPPPGPPPPERAPPGASVLAQAYGRGRVWLLLVLGFSSGLPLALTASALTAWATDAGVDLTTVGLFYAVTLPYSVKFLWAPALDWVPPPFLGRRRGWAIVVQLGLIGSLVLLSMFDPKAEPLYLAGGALLVAAFSATQDIVLDAYRTDILAPAERAAGASTFVTGYRVGMLVSGGLALTLADSVSWSTVYQLMAACVAIGLVAVLFAPEPARVAVVRPRSIQEILLEPLRAFARRRGALIALLFMLGFKIGDAFAGALTTRFIKELGFTNTELGTLHTTLGIIATIAGGFFAGAVLPKLGARKGLIVFGAVQALTNICFWAMAVSTKSYMLLVIAVVVDNVAGGMGTAAFVAFLMGLCDKRYTATHYAVFSSISAFPARVLGALSGAMAAALGWPVFFLATIALAVPGVILAFLLPRELVEVPLVDEPS